MISRLLCMVPQYVGMLQYQKILKRTQFVGWRAKNVIFMAPNRTLAHTPAQQHPVLLPVHLTFCSWKSRPALTLHTYATPATHVQNDGRDTLGQTISESKWWNNISSWRKISKQLHLITFENSRIWNLCFLGTCVFLELVFSWNLLPALAQYLDQLHLNRDIVTF